MAAGKQSVCTAEPGYSSPLSPYAGRPSTSSLRRLNLLPRIPQNKPGSPPNGKLGQGAYLELCGRKPSRPELVEDELITAAQNAYLHNLNSCSSVQKLPFRGAVLDVAWGTDDSHVYAGGVSNEVRLFVSPPSSLPPP